MIEDNKEWLASLKEGDTVAIISYGLGTNYNIKKIDRITPTGRIKINDVQFDNTGREMGKKDTWTSKSEIVPVTTEIKEKIEKEKLLFKITRPEIFKDCTLQQLRDIHNILGG